MTKLRLADENRLGTVVVFRNRPVDRHKGRRTVMMRDVPFDAAGNPRAQHSDERGLHDVLTVEEIVVVRFIRRLENTTAKVGRNSQLDVFVFKAENPIRRVGFLVAENIAHRVRIDAPLSSLIYAPRIKDRILIRQSKGISRNRRDLFRSLDRLRSHDGRSRQ